MEYFEKSIDLFNTSYKVRAYIKNTIITNRVEWLKKADSNQLAAKVENGLKPIIDLSPTDLLDKFLTYTNFSEREAYIKLLHVSNPFNHVITE
jgi:hypothetical protein